MIPNTATIAKSIVNEPWLVAIAPDSAGDDGTGVGEPPVVYGVVNGFADGTFIQNDINNIVVFTIASASSDINRSNPDAAT